MKWNKACKIFIGFTLFLLLSNLALAASKNNNVNPDDPYETYNRHAYALNQGLDKAIFKPVATVYNAALPGFARQGVNNFFSNLDNLPTIINDLLQGEFLQATTASWRFVVNSTFGVAGLFDVATPIGLEQHNNDLGLTLAKWGYTDSAYLILPIFGPQTVRDAVALPVNLQFFTVYPYIQNATWRNSLLVLWFVDTRAQLLRYDSTIQILSFDPYVFERNAYLQHRAAKIKRSKNANIEKPVDNGLINSSTNHSSIQPTKTS